MLVKEMHVSIKTEPQHGVKGYWTGREDGLSIRIYFDKHEKFSYPELLLLGVTKGQKDYACWIFWK